MSAARQLDRTSLRGQLARGQNVIIGLAVLTTVEFIISAADVAASFVLLTIIAFAKAALIVHYFMHMHQLWREDVHTWQ
jgi:heme/copper-type cytochrome/quinol oxidase subunit 4